MDPVVLSGWGIGTSVATILAAIIAAATLVYIAIQAGAVKDQVIEMKEQAERVREQAERVREQTEVIRGQTKENRAYEYMKRFNDPSFRLMAAAAIRLLEDPDVSETEKWKTLEDKKSLENVTLQANVTNLLNFFEELGVMYNKELIDEGIIKEFFPTISDVIYRYANKWYIPGRRERTGRKTIYKNWKRMNDDLKRI